MVYATFNKILSPLLKKKLAEVSGAELLPRRGPYILAANHLDYLDGFYIAMAVYQSRQHKVYFLTKTTNYWWTNATIPIEAGRRSESVDDALRHLRAGRVICNFIEGQRNSSRRLLPGKTGTSRIALLADVPVIPVGVVGPSARNFAQSLASLITERENVAVHFGPEVDLDRWRRQPLDYRALQAATDQIMRALVPLTGKAYAG
ncbi:MAG: 1-acyl-sn-glycerol-3-phosphate acyltransferase [Candidatus Kerfeldbacteria bacterium]|nr:1-acyl-sn-glycerol-3-phosphate acyltransferase [Candidatus Kerfeldbacteria bacterium]